MSLGDNTHLIDQFKNMGIVPMLSTQGANAPGMRCLLTPKAGQVEEFHTYGSQGEIIILEGHIRYNISQIERKSLVQNSSVQAPVLSTIFDLEDLMQVLVV